MDRTADSDSNRPEDLDLVEDRREDELSPRRKAAELRARFQWLETFTDEELREITIRAEGDELAPGNEYFDLSHPEDGMIVAPKGKRVPHKGAYVARDDVPQAIWDKLIGGRMGHLRQAL